MLPPCADLTPLREAFPALKATDSNGRPYVYFDGPGGTQVPQVVIDAMADYFCSSNANAGGRYVVSRRNDAMIAAARGTMADFLNAPSADEIVFGPNMTSLTFHLSRSIADILQPGDEIVVTRLDHDANISPWLALQSRGVAVKWADFNPADCRLDLEHLATLISARTKLVAVGYASNAVGTINPITEIVAMAHAVGAWAWVDAVQYAPHGVIDVQDLGCDFLVCSAYKFFGPHVGILWGRREHLERLAAYKVRPASSETPFKFEPGTPNHEGIAGTAAAVDYLARVGCTFGAPPAVPSDCSERRRNLIAAMSVIKRYESNLFRVMLERVLAIPNLTVYGITDPDALDQRCPTLAFTIAGKTPPDIAAALGEQGIFVWDGNYYALAVTEHLGLEASGGMVRAGLTHYNTESEIDRFVSALEEVCNKGG